MFDLLFLIPNNDEQTNHSKVDLKNKVKLSFKAKNSSEARQWVSMLRQLHEKYGNQVIETIEDDNDFNDSYDHDDRSVAYVISDSSDIALSPKARASMSLISNNPLLTIESAPPQLEQEITDLKEDSEDNGEEEDG
eukprot:CAMPEP_0114359772 /NCGR_PEP_ID=MMETSP0101-20121206/23272_1 /TAXON_ID=38822 ORGANISM="Pteridomonas danica, Strain PT" /NCGR_SAMPLE_ID=MMETSP0101 /ASSEMBLY_ACC=CAM_ASM_000211 /LENGTH=135 /DNA_ID=CAMNT_0001503491 /DNA_START=158 /DNA_END=561 /DNA_ORIENTATION=+